MKAIFPIAALVFAAPAALAQAPAAPPARNVPGGQGHLLRGIPVAVAYDGAMAAVNACKAKGYLIGAVVVDDAGGVIVAASADGAPTEGFVGGVKKAVTSVTEKADGGELVERAKNDPAFKAKIAADKSLIAREGSLLIHAGGKIVGAIGVEGAPHELANNVSCAQAGVDRIEGRLK